MFRLHPPPASGIPASVPASGFDPTHWPLVVLQVKPAGQLVKVHLGEHWRVAALQRLPTVLAAQSMSVAQTQKVATELLIRAHVFSELGQSLGPAQVFTHSLSTG